MQVHHFAYGWINPTIAFVLSFLGSLLGLVLAGRAGETTGLARVRWLVLAAVGLGGTGVWLSHFMAMLGFDVPGSLLRYQVPATVLSAALSILAVAAGLLIAGMGPTGATSTARMVLGALCTGLGMAAMQYIGMAAIQLDGRLSFDRRLAALSVACAVIAAAVTLWCAVAARGSVAIVGGALLIAVATCSVHYTAMATARVHLDANVVVGSGVHPFVLLVPICIVATLVIAALAYSTVGVAIRQENDRAEERWARVRAERYGYRPEPIPVPVAVRGGHGRHR